MGDGGDGVQFRMLMRKLGEISKRMKTESLIKLSNLTNVIQCKALFSIVQEPWQLKERMVADQLREDTDKQTLKGADSKSKNFRIQNATISEWETLK